MNAVTPVVSVEMARNVIQQTVNVCLGAKTVSLVTFARKIVVFFVETTLVIYKQGVAQVVALMATKTLVVSVSKVLFFF